MGIRRLEVNAQLLAGKCEQLCERVARHPADADARFKLHAFVASLRSLVAEMELATARNKDGHPSALAARAQLTQLERFIGDGQGPAQCALLAPSPDPTGGAAIAAEAHGAGHGARDSPSGRPADAPDGAHPSRPHARTSNGRRSGGAEGVAGGTRALRVEQETQEELTEHLDRLAQVLKLQAQEMNSALRSDVELLEQTSDVVQRNLDASAKASAELERQVGSTFSWKFTWSILWPCLLVVMVLAITIAMALFIRLMPKPRA